MAKNHRNILIFVLIVVIGMLWFKYDVLKKDNRRLLNEVKNYDSALNEANDNIEQANSNIEDAQSYAGESYDDMEYALENLETVDTVSRP